MNVDVRPPLRSERAERVRPAIVDCDIHPRTRSPEDLKPYLTNRWWDYLQTYGARRRHGYTKGTPYPKAQPGDASRRDAWPPGGGLPGCDLDFMREQHLDAYGITHGVMNPLGLTGQGDQNREFSAALTSAINDWQVAAWCTPEPRLKASIVVPYEDGEASRAEINKRAGNKSYAQVMLLSRTSEALGRPRYWPIYEAAVEHDLVVGIHVFGYSGWPISNSGWPSFYIEEMTEHETACSALVTSMILEGVFERYPTLKVAMIESGFAWLPPLGWRLDKHWKRLKDEVPHLRKAPSEYIREHFWISTQPMEEPEKPDHLIDVMNWIGFDRIMFASDYPHWDFDDPFMALPPSLDEARRGAIYSGNAQKLYGFA
jgi:predicted TIM-barrel fold metal-dependent hydrolase